MLEKYKGKIMTTEEFKEIAYKYAYGLEDTIIKAFKSYDLYFEWVSGWLIPPTPDTVIVNGPYMNGNDTKCRCSIRLYGLNPELTKEIKDNKDSKVIEKFVIDILENYIANKTPEGFTVDYKGYYMWVRVDDGHERYPGKSGLVVPVDLNLIYSGEVEE